MGAKAKNPSEGPLGTSEPIEDKDLPTGGRKGTRAKGMEEDSEGEPKTLQKGGSMTDKIHTRNNPHRSHPRRIPGKGFAQISQASNATRTLWG